MYFTTLFSLLFALHHPQTSHQSLPWIWGWEFGAGQWCAENHRCFQISFQRVCSREIFRAALLTGVPTALQPGLFTEPKGIFNLRRIRLRVSNPPDPQQGSAPAQNCSSPPQILSSAVQSEGERLQTFQGCSCFISNCAEIAATFSQARQREFIIIALVRLPVAFLLL